MKALLNTAFILIFSSSLLALPQKLYGLSLLECLGVEELYFHQNKKLGPAYKLNQLFIDEISSNSTLRLKKRYANLICKNPQDTSLNLLHQIILHGKKVFKENNGFDKGLSFVSKINPMLPKIFFGLVNDIQKLTDDAHCLDNNIDHLKYFKERYLYLEPEIQEKALFQHKAKLQKTFTQLKKYSDIIKNCQINWKEKEKEKQDRFKRQKSRR